MEVNCSCCNKVINKKPSHIKKYKNLYCSKECRGIGWSKTVTVDCACCGISMNRKPHEVTASKTGRLFCSKSCSAKVSNADRGGYGVTQYRVQAFKELPHECDICSYSKVPGVLQVHHKDRDRSNNDITNLQILCPTCHAVDHYNNNDGGFWKTSV